MSSIYVETTIIGYLTARSDQLIFAARQELTRRWWNDQRANYDLVVSDLVIAEVAAGDPQAASERLEYISDLDILDSSSEEIVTVAEKLLSKSALPENARPDAVHVACATIHRVQYLLTWNCKHIANANQLPLIYETIRNLGLEPPLIVTPEEFSNDE